MSNRKIALTVLITLVLIAILAAGGFAIYRLGYVQGVSESAGVMMQGYGGHFGGERAMPFHDFNGLGELRGRMPMADFAHPGFRSYTPFGGFSGLLLLIGVAALVVIAVNGIVKRREPKAGMEITEPTEDLKPKRRSGK